MPTTADLAATYTARYNRLRLATAAAVGRTWDRLAGPDERSLQRFSDEALTLVLAAQSQVTAAVDGYMATLAQATPIGIDPVYPRPADPVEVYRRGGITVRSALAAGVPFLDAMAKGRTRTVSTAATDITLAQRAATVEVVDQQPGIVGYRRVLTGESCAFCATASTQRYGSGDLAPIHGNCDCGVAPIVGTKDPGHVVNSKLVEDLRAAAKETGDTDYWKSRHIRVDADGTVTFPKPAVHDHGELGPVLTDPHHEFTAVGDIAA